MGYPSKDILPSKDKYYNTLTNCAFSDENYEHDLNFWKVFKMNTMKDYHGLYLQVNVLLLGCVFETFKEESINYFELGPPHFLSTPENG